MFKQIAAAIVMGTAKAANDIGFSRPVEPARMEEKENEVEEIGMLDFAQRIAKTYGGEVFDAKAAAKSIANEKGFAASNQARCPCCSVLLELGPLDAEDECASCKVWLKVVLDPRSNILKFSTRRRPLNT